MHNILIEDHQIPGSERHNFIVNTFDSLSEGDSIILKSEFDPKYLRDQFNKNRPDQFRLEYLVDGPNEWKVKITKIPEGNGNFLQ